MKKLMALSIATALLFTSSFTFAVKSTVTVKPTVTQTKQVVKPVVKAKTEKEKKAELVENNKKIVIQQGKDIVLLMDSMSYCQDLMIELYVDGVIYEGTYNQGMDVIGEFMDVLESMRVTVKKGNPLHSKQIEDVKGIALQILDLVRGYME